MIENDDCVLTWRSSSDALYFRVVVMCKCKILWRDHYFNVKSLTSEVFPNELIRVLTWTLAGTICNCGSELKLFDLWHTLFLNSESIRYNRRFGVFGSGYSLLSPTEISFSNCFVLFITVLTVDVMSDVRDISFVPTYQAVNLFTAILYCRISIYSTC